MRIQRVGLAVVPGVEQPGPRCKFRRNIDNRLPGLEQPLRQRPARATGAFDRPQPGGPHRDVAAHLDIAGTIGAEPSRADQQAAPVHYLDRRRQLVRINPDDHIVDHSHDTPCLSPR